MRLAAFVLVLGLVMSACAASAGVDGDLFGDDVQAPPSSQVGPSDQAAPTESSTDTTLSLDPDAPHSGSAPTTIQKPDPPASLPPLSTTTTAPAASEDGSTGESIQIPAGLEQAVLFASTDLAERLGIPIESISVARAEFVTWPDSSLGCPQPGMMYTQVLTDGVLVALLANGASYEYHGGSAGDPFWCPSPTPPSSSGYGDK